MKRLVAGLAFAAAAAALLAPAVSSAASKATTHTSKVQVQKVQGEHHCPLSGAATSADL